MVSCLIPSLQNGYYTVNGSPAENSQQFGKTLQSVCNTGFILQGTSSRICGADKQWTGSAPQCIAITCSNVPNVSNGRYDTGN